MTTEPILYRTDDGAPMTDKPKISLALARAVQLSDDGATDAGIAQSMETDVPNVRQLLRQARALGALTGHTAVWPVFLALLETTAHEPDAKRLVAARAAGQYWDPSTADLFQDASADAVDEPKGGGTVKLHKWEGWFQVVLEGYDQGRTAAEIAPDIGKSVSSANRAWTTARRVGAAEGSKKTGTPIRVHWPKVDEWKAAGKLAEIAPGAPPAADDTPVVSHCNTDATQERTPDVVQRMSLPFTEEQIGALQRIAEREMDRITIRRSGGKAIPFSGRMDPAVYEALKAYAAEQQLTTTEVLTRAVESYLMRAGGTPGAGHDE